MERGLIALQNGDIKEDAQKDYEETLEALDNKYSNEFCQQSDIEVIANDLLATIPKINRNKLREEMSDMHVQVYDNPTTFNINEGLAKAQGYRERLAGILVLATREFNIREKILEMLTMANNVSSKASSADKRKGEALMKYASYFISLEAAETFKDEVNMYLNNMKSTSETISRQASVLQAQITLGEVHKVDKLDEWENKTRNAAAEEISFKKKKSTVEELDW